DRPRQRGGVRGVRRLEPVAERAEVDGEANLEATKRVQPFRRLHLARASQRFGHAPTRIPVLGEPLREEATIFRSQTNDFHSTPRTDRVTPRTDWVVLLPRRPSTPDARSRSSRKPRPSQTGAATS